MNFDPWNCRELLSQGIPSLGLCCVHGLIYGRKNYPCPICKGEPMDRGRWALRVSLAATLAHVGPNGGEQQVVPTIMRAAKAIGDYELSVWCEDVSVKNHWLKKGGG